MLVEIPDFEVIFNVIVAFLVGLFGLYAYYKIEPHLNLKKTQTGLGQAERLEHYERQLIDMKIRLDALDLAEDLASGSAAAAAASTQQKPQAVQAAEGAGEKHPPSQAQKTLDSTPSQPPAVVPATITPPQAQRLPNMTSNNAADYVLQLITDKPMTSRDIQVTLGRSREHTSRLMKRLFEDGFVDRNASSKPYTYSITEKGRNKIGSANGPSAMV